MARGHGTIIAFPDELLNMTTSVESSTPDDCQPIRCDRLPPSTHTQMHRRRWTHIFLVPSLSKDCGTSKFLSSPQASVSAWLHPKDWALRFPFSSEDPGSTSMTKPHPRYFDPAIMVEWSWSVPTEASGTGQAKMEPCSEPYNRCV